MASNESKNEMLVMVLIDLASICRKLNENDAVPEALRAQAGQLVDEFNLLLPHRGKGTPLQHFQGESLLLRMANFIPRVVEVNAKPAYAPGA